MDTGGDRESNIFKTSNMIDSYFSQVRNPHAKKDYSEVTVDWEEIRIYVEVHRYT